MNKTFHQDFDLSTLQKPKRQEQKTVIGSVISGGGYNISAGRYLDHGNIGHVAVRVTDPAIRDGEPMYYLIPRENALKLAEALQKAAVEVPL